MRVSERTVWLLLRLHTDKQKLGVTYELSFVGSGELAGQSADYAYNQMVDIKSGARANGQTAAMKGIMHLVNEEEMRAIADWLAK